MLVIGLVTGSVLTALVFGMREGGSSDIGSGLKSLVESSRSQRDREQTAAAAPERREQPPTKFDFYTVLPEIESVLPSEAAPSDAAPAEPAPPARTEEGVFYMLQAGSYASYADADRLKARLALLGLAAHIQKVSVENRGNFFRVRLGPFIDLNKLAAVDRQLSAEGIRALRLKIERGAAG